VRLGEGGLLLGALLLFAWALLALMRQRDAALAVLRRWCRAEGLQLLDDGLAFAGLRRRDLGSADGKSRRRWCQAFRFEVSEDGRRRRPGLLLMRGRAALLLEIEDGDGGHLIEVLDGTGKQATQSARRLHRDPG
jgi:hypothetical protein